LGELDPYIGRPTLTHIRRIPHRAVDAVSGPLESLGDGTAEPPAGTSDSRRRSSLHFVLFSMDFIARVQGSSWSNSVSEASNAPSINHRDDLSMG
jgi:hypothetical protein